MENSIEDIEKVENLIKRCDECKLKECINCETDWTEIASIKRIVDSYKKVLKENEELKEKKKNIEPVLIGNKMYFIDKGLYEDLLNDIKSNYIPIQKITDKMEKLNKEIKNAETIEAVFKIKQQQALQELLEEGVVDK